MKLIKVTTIHTQDEIDYILGNLNKHHIEILERLYSTFNYVEFLNEDNFVSMFCIVNDTTMDKLCLLYTSPSPRDGLLSRMPSSA